MSLAIPPHEAAIEGQERVTVVIPTFNDDPEHLRTAVGSALAQTWGELEVIVVNDGSTLPETREALEGLPPGVQVIHQANGGVGSARNTGIEAASGEVIICLDADDRIDPQYVAEAVHTLAQPGTVVAFPFCVTFGAVSGEQPTAPWWTRSMPCEGQESSPLRLSERPVGRRSAGSTWGTPPLKKTGSSGAVCCGTAGWPGGSPRPSSTGGSGRTRGVPWSTLTRPEQQSWR